MGASLSNVAAINSQTLLAFPLAVTDEVASFFANCFFVAAEQPPQERLIPVIGSTVLAGVRDHRLHTCDSVVPTSRTEQKRSQMFWWYEREGQHLRVEVLQIAAHKYELRLTDADGTERSRRSTTLTIWQTVKHSYRTLCQAKGGRVRTVG